MPQAATGEVRQFLEVVSSGRIHAYDDDSAKRKSQFHSIGKKLLRRIAKDLGYQRGEFDVRSNMGGIAVCGEVTLHTDDLYVQMSTSGTSGLDILYRTCEGRKDYTGGRNHWLAFVDLNNYADAVRDIRCLRQSS